MDRSSDRGPRCPTCETIVPPATPRPSFAPFCSPRCKMADLAHWLRGDYAVPAAPTDDGDGETPREDASG